MPYIPRPDIPAPLLAALIESDEEYGSEVRNFLRSQKNDYEYITSVTSLGTQTQKSILLKRHWKDLWIDPAKQWHAFMGNVVHWVLEKNASGNPRYITEQRIAADIYVDGRLCLVHGKFDLFDKSIRTIQDWKLTNASYMGYDKSAHHDQLNILRWIMVQHGHKVEALQNVYLFPHLDKSKSKYDDYPKENWLVKDAPIRPLDQVEEMIRIKIRRQLTELEKSDKNLTPCTDEERWIRGNLISIYLRKSAKLTKAERDAGKEKQDFSTKAAKHFSLPDDQDELDKWEKANKVPVEDIFRKATKGAPKACDYCLASQVCRQYLTERAAKDNERYQQSQQHDT